MSIFRRQISPLYVTGNIDLCVDKIAAIRSFDTQLIMASSTSSTKPNQVDEAIQILIYGGSTATGTLAIQLTELSGHRVLTTCSPHNFALVKRLGADNIFNYRDPGSATTIREHT